MEIRGHCSVGDWRASSCEGVSLKVKSDHRYFFSALYNKDGIKAAS